MPRALSDLSDTELQSVADGLPPLEQFDDHQLAALAVHQGLMQEDDAINAVQEKRQAERAPAADAAAEASATAAGTPAFLTKALLTRGGRVGDVAAETLLPIAGQVAGSALAPGPGTAVGGAAGGVGGDALAQTREYFRGERDSFSKGRNIAAGIAGGIPIGGRILKKPAEVIVKRALQGAGISAGSQAVGELIDNGRLNFKQLAVTGVLGALIGGGAGGVEAALTRRAVLKAIRGTPEFAEFSGTDKELVNEVRKRMTPEAPAAPGEKNVTPAAEPAAQEVPPAPAAAEPAPLTQMNDDELLSLAQRTEKQPIAPKGPAEPAPAVDVVNPPEAAPSAALEQYKAQPASRGGRYISADVARPLVPGFDPANPSATNHQASEIAEQAFQEGLKDPKVEQVTILAGGAGSGKSSANEYAGGDNEMVYDGVFGSQSSVRRLDQTVHSGKPVRVLYVYRPMADAISGMISRRGGNTGVVPADVVAGGHYRSAENFLAAAKRYEGNPNVQFQVIDNSGPKGSARLVENPVRFLEQVTKNRPSYEQALAEAKNHPAVADLSPSERSTYLGGEVAPTGASQRGQPEPGGVGVTRQAEVTPPASGRDYVYNVQRADVMKDGRRVKPFVQIDPTDNPRGNPLTKAEREALPQPPDHLPTGTYTLKQVQDAIAAAPPKTTKVSPGESVVSPSPQAEHAVSSLASAKQIKVQREYLLDAVNAAAAKAKSSPEFARELSDLTKRQRRVQGNALTDDALNDFNQRHGEFITFHVPNDGTYRVHNNKEALEAFAAKVEKRFGKGLKSPEPTKRVIPKMTDAERREHQVPPEDSAPNVGRGAAASIGRVGELPPPPAENTAPVDDPTYSQLPLQLPEMVQFYKMIADGKVPAIVEKIRIMRGEALGVFRWQAGKLGSDSIELRADLFHLLSGKQKNDLLSDAVAWATAMKQAHPEMRFAESVKRRFYELVKAAEAKALKEDPRRALDVFAHEIGHYVDFLPNADLKRGNILGRIASLKRYLKEFMGEHPSVTAQPPNRNERATLRRQAERELEASVKEITETLRREVPVYASIPITADHITSILKQAQRDEFPELYDWFAGLDRADKVAVLRSAMKGIVDERAADLGARKQVGTQMVDEEVTRKVGAEVTPEAIRQRYSELLRKELKRRGLISEKDVRRELEETVAWWQGVDKIPAYFTSSHELYAETFSVLLNNPAALAKRAPTFWRAFFNYLDRKPEVKAAYEKIQDDIKSGAIYRQRVENLRGAWREDEASAQLQEIAGTRLDWRKVRDTLRLLFDRQHGPIEARALRRLDSPQSQQVLAALKNYLYRMTAIEGYARDLNLRVEKPLAEAGLTHSDLAEFMFHQRIAAGDRQELANAQGFSPKTSADRLQEMARELGPQRFAALDVAQTANRETYERGVVSLLERADVLTPELLKVIRERTLYATFAKTREFNPLEHGTIEGLLQGRYGKDVTARIYRQIGYLGDVRSPYLAMTQKAFALINFAYKQMAVKAVRDFMLEHEPHLIAEAEQRFTGGRWEPRLIDTAKIGTLITIDKGEVSAFYVPREIAETLEHGSPLEMMIVGLAHRVLALPKALLTELNAGFWPVAFAKDLMTLGLQLPRGGRALATVPKAYQAARALSSGAENALADAALRRLMVISRADPRGEHLGHPDEMTRVLLRMGQSPQLWDAEVAKISRAMRTWMWWKRQGQTLERTVKIAGMIHLDSEAFAAMPEWQKKRLVNELAGSPDFLERGRAAPIVELAGGPIFYNAWLQGMRAFKRAAQNDPRGFWTKFLTFFGLPALALYAFEKGLTNLGLDKEKAEDHRDMLRSIPERDKLRGFVLPLGWSDKSQGKVAYLMLPFPDQVRYLNAGLRKAAQTAGGDGAKNLGLESMVQFGGQDLPGQNPMIAEASKWWQFAALGQNPYDSFRGKPAINDDKFKAGEGAADLAKQSAANLTGGILYKYRPSLPGDNPTDMEKFLQLPGVGNLLGRWVRVSNAGLTEETDRTLAPVIEHQAQMRLVADEMARKTIAGQPWTAAEDTLSQNDPYLVQYLMGKMQTLMENATGPEMQAFNRAQNVEQKAALLEAWAARDKQRAARLQPAAAAK